MTQIQTQKYGVPPGEFGLKIIEAKGLTKKFADHLVVNNVNFDVKVGECFGILGPGSAGKSTLMKMIYGSAALQAGELFVAGLNARTNMKDIKARIGVLPQEEGFEQDFTVRENLHLYGSYHGVDHDVTIHRTEDLLKLMRLEDLGDQFVHVLSEGMKRRLGIARAMINQPELLILDEPTLNLDSAGRTGVWDFIRKVRSEMGTILLTTHYMEEAEKICDRIALMDKGRILAIDEPRKLIREMIGVQVVELEVSSNELQYYLSRLNTNKYRFQVVQENINVHLQNQDEVPKVMSLIQSLKVTIRQPNLSDVFFKLAGRNLREEPL